MQTKRTFIKSIFALFATIGIYNPLSSKPMKHIEEGFVHVVYFWLKRPENDGDRTSFLKSLKTYLGKVEVIQSSFVGSPAASDRDVVDDSFTFNIVLTFKTIEDQEIYQEHPAHLKFIEESSALWNKVVVYDALPV